MNKNNVWFITAKTNLHVGDENSSCYGLIDLAVQRNATTGLPCINSSSLKGALNEYASQFDDLDRDRVKIFGSDKKDKSKDTKKGQYTFFDANILFLPRQSETNLYELVTCQQVIDRFLAQMELMGIKLTEQDLRTKFPNFIVLDTTEEFNDICSNDNLPIIARNVLDNGESKNLWYEQVIPAETVFYTIIDDKGDGALAGKLRADNAIVQIGANATIGYGYCSFMNP